MEQRLHRGQGAAISSKRWTKPNGIHELRYGKTCGLFCLLILPLPTPFIHFFIEEGKSCCQSLIRVDSIISIVTLIVNRRKSHSYSY